MNTVSFAQYVAFCDTKSGGSQAAIVTATSATSRQTRMSIAREIGMPATAFIDGVGDDWVEAQFMSTVMELPMCGHGTICLLTHIVESGVMPWDGEGIHTVDLRLSAGSATVTLNRCKDRRVKVMLDVNPPTFSLPPPDAGRLSELLGLTSRDFAPDLILETARGDFIHLIVPLRGLDAMRKAQPDFDAVVRYCRRYGIETIVIFCREVENPGSTIHVRDFCPAVGVEESAAAGTTNAALTGYLIRHGIVQADDSGRVVVDAEQGHEINRPSSIRSVATMKNDRISRLQVGGVATKVKDGQVYL